MPAAYLLRFDDICPTMNWTIWREVEAILMEAGISPILAVVPDNRDPELMVEAPRETFWEEVREWQRRGWTIGLHGYQHIYVTQCAGILGRNGYSEFAGLSYDAQVAKLRNALAIFARHGVRPDVWIAPAHSFDRTTLDALAHCGIDAVSDGYSVLPHTGEHGMLWVPQQIARFRSFPVGVWTVCHHHNTWSAADMRRFRADIAAYRERIGDFDSVARRYAGRPEKWMDRASAGVMSMARIGRMAISRGNA